MKLLIIDSNALLHRSFHALPPLKNKKGQETGAVYGFLLTLFKAIGDIDPDYIVATFDTPAPTFRHKKFKEYKAGRQKAPDEFYKQIPLAKKILSAFLIPVLEKEGFEADDIIATISKKALQKTDLSDIEVYIITGDLDTLQLVDEKTKVYTLGIGIKNTVIYDNKKIMERFELTAGQMVDFRALAGDPSDNIPGAPGIGKKTATELLKEFRSLEELYQKLESDEAEEIKPRVKNILFQNKEQVFFSQMLAQTRKDAPVDFNIQDCKFGDFNRKELEKIFKDCEFFSLINRIPGGNHSNQNKIPISKNGDGKIF